MPRNKHPADLMGFVAKLWCDHYNGTLAGLKSLTEAVFNIPWVVKNVPRNPSTLKMMAKMVRVLIIAMIVCCSDRIQNHLTDQRLPPLWS